jgi:hypothetical protein
VEVEMKRIALPAIAIVLMGALASCSRKVPIRPESGTTSATSSSGATMTMPGGTGGSTMSSGAGGVGGAATSSSGNTSSGMSSSSSTSSGAAPAKVVTADNDIAQYLSITVPVASMPQKVVDGPFFVTDVFGQLTLDMVTGGDCTVPQSQHTTLLGTNNTTTFPQVHGMRMPILANQTLCANTNSSSPAAVLGFRPY